MAIRVVVAGLGGRGLDWIREARREPGFELSAFVDRDADILQQAASRLSLQASQCFPTLEEALAAAPSDAVIVATPAETHAQVCETALSKGLAVLVEKPFTTSLHDAVRLVRLAEDKALPLIVAQNYRYMRAFRTVRRLIAEGALGRVGLIVCQYYRVPHEMAPSLERIEHSVIWGNGIHHLDALRYVLNQRVTNVSAESFTLAWGKLTQGASFRAMLQLEEGARAIYSATYESSGHEFFERGQEFYARFTGERATLHLFHRWLILCERGRFPRPIRRGRREITEERLLLRQLESAMTSNAPAETSGRDNLQTIATVEACLRSSVEGRPINPQELLYEAERPQTCVSHRH